MRASALTTLVVGVVLAVSCQHTTGDVVYRVDDTDAQKSANVAVLQEDGVDDHKFIFTNETDPSEAKHIAHDLSGPDGSESLLTNFFPNGDNPEEHNVFNQEYIVNPTPGPPAWDYKWTFCAKEGQVCQCGCPGSGEMLIRYGSLGNVSLYADHNHFLEEHPDIVRWDYEELGTKVGLYELLCDPLAFMHRDPFPGEEKHCECAHVSGPNPDCGTPTPTPVNSVPKATPEPTPIPTLLAEPATPTPTPMIDPNQQYWTTCAAEGGECECGGGKEAMARFGSTGKTEFYMYDSAYFKENPSVRRWDYKVFGQGESFKFHCEQNSFQGTDPFPGEPKHCQCNYNANHNQATKPTEEVIASVPFSQAEEATSALTFIDTHPVEAPKEDPMSSSEVYVAVLTGMMAAVFALGVLVRRLLGFIDSRVAAGGAESQPLRRKGMGGFYSKGSNMV